MRILRTSRAPEAVTSPVPPRPRFRLTLYRKIVGGIGIIILFVSTVIFALYSFIKPYVFTDDPQSRSFELSLDLGTLFNAEHVAAENYFRVRSARSLEMLQLVEKRFNGAKDSLALVAGGAEAKLALEELSVDFHRYSVFIDDQIAHLSQDSSFDALAALRSAGTLEDTIRKRVEAVTRSTLPPLYTSLKTKQAEAENAKALSLIVLMLSLVIAIAITWFIARTLIKPLKALMSRAEKVGEGIYETVPVTSSDETAELAHAFNIMSEKLRQLDEMRMQLMSEISHEMRTPLQVIKAGCYSIVHTKDGPTLTQRQRDAVGMIHQATNRINQFVNSFLDIAKMEAGLMKFTFEPLDIVELVTPLIQEAQLIGQTRQITVEFHAAEIPPIMIDKDRMSQVFSNLLSNALKYTPDHGCITIAISRTNGLTRDGSPGKPAVAIEVRDTGVGIPEADLKKLFSKFYQAKNVPLVNEKGSGLGLALVKHVAEAHGGKVSVSSQVGVGSTFTVLLPEQQG